MRDLVRALTSHGITLPWATTMILLAGLGIYLGQGHTPWAVMRDMSHDDILVTLSTLTSLFAAGAASKVATTPATWLDVTARHGVRRRQLAAYLVALVVTSWPLALLLATATFRASVLGMICQAWGLVAAGALASLLRRWMWWLPATCALLVSAGAVLPRQIHPLSVSSHPLWINIFWIATILAAGITTVWDAERRCPPRAPSGHLPTTRSTR